MKRSIFFVVAMFLAFMGRPALAGTIEYAWEGTILPNVPNVDPWNIGAAGKPFTITGIVDENAVDIDPEVGGAFFDLTDVALLIDGIAATEFHDGTIWFQELGGSDSVDIASDEVVFNGRLDGFLTFVALPKSTFTLTNAAEAPPVFSPAMMLSQQGAGTDASSYHTLVDGGVVVTATRIPEPTTFVLALMVALGAATTRRRGRIP